MVTAEEGTGTQRNLVELPSSDKDFAGSVERGSRQLFDEVVEHGAIGHFEGAGIVDEGVAAHLNLDAGGAHHGFAQLADVETTAHLDEARQCGNVFPSLNSKLLPHIGIAFLRSAQQVVARGNHRADVDECAVVSFKEDVGTVVFHFDAVGSIDM